MSKTIKSDLDTKKQEFEKLGLVQQYLDLANQWQRTYCHLVRDLADAFGEEEVLDIVEKTWWDQAYEVGLTWRDRFAEDPQEAMRDKAESWHNNALWARICCCDVPVLEDDRWELIALKCYREVFNEMSEPRIGISWCMTDLAAVRGWSPNILMEQPKHLLRGDNHCHQIRVILTDGDTDPELDQWSTERSEKHGWRSVRRLEP